MKTAESHNAQLTGKIDLVEHAAKSLKAKVIDYAELARRIRVMAIQSPNPSVMSTEFGNWFAPRVEKMIASVLKNEQDVIREIQQVAIKRFVEKILDQQELWPSPYEGENSAYIIPLNDVLAVAKEEGVEI